MDYGKVDNPDSIKFSLPKDHSDNKKVLGGKKSKTKIYTGCAKWGRKEWVGKIYPTKTKEKDFLAQYVKQFNCIELNATHYNIYSSSTINKWKETSEGIDFKFCPKFYQGISHFRRLKNAEHDTENFLNSISNLGEKLGTCFLQLPPNFTPKSFNELKNYLEKFPKEPEVCIELRHPLWFSDEKIADETFSMFKEMGFGNVITDTSGRRDVMHMRLTTRTAFIRFVGNNLHKTDYTRVDEWIERLKVWIDSGLETAYFMLHQHDEAYTPELAVYTIKKMNDKLNAELKEINYFNESYNSD